MGIDFVQVEERSPKQAKLEDSEEYEVTETITKSDFDKLVQDEEDEFYNELEAHEAEEDLDYTITKIEYVYPWRLITLGLVLGIFTGSFITLLIFNFYKTHP